MFTVGKFIQITHCTADEGAKLSIEVHRLASSGMISEDLQNFVSKILPAKDAN